MTARTLPHNLEAERSVLGSILLYWQILDGLDLPSDAMYSPAHRDILIAMRTVRGRGRPVDIITLEEELRTTGKLAQVGGVAALSDLSGAVATVEGVGYHARIIQEKALLRRLIQTCSEFAAEGYADPTDAEALITRAVSGVSACYGTALHSRTLGDVLDSVMGHIEEAEELRQAGREDEIPPQGIPTGMADLDERLTYRGLATQQPTILAADSTAGKPTR